MASSHYRGDQVKRTAEAVQEWLRPDNSDLKRAIDRTVAEGLFGVEDIRHQIRSLKKRLTSEALEHWSLRHESLFESAGLETARRTRTLVFHAGNLPLAGLQDLVACSLAGVNFAGKFSKKDPYIVASIINNLESTGALIDPQFSTSLNHLPAGESDLILFSGSEQSIPLLSSQPGLSGLRTGKARFLARTAHYSVAYIESQDKTAMEQLTEAVFRYGGKGCRSVGAVITPFSLQEEICHTTDYIESFWLKNPQHEKPPPSLFHRYAYNRAIGVPQSWYGDFLIEESRERPVTPFLLHWIQGDRETAARFVLDFKEGLQSVYSYPFDPNPIGGILPEPLSQAQDPPIDWKPDGTDTLEWLLKNIGNRPAER